MANATAVPMSEVAGEPEVELAVAKSRHFATHIVVEDPDSKNSEVLLSHDRRNPYDFVFAFPRDMDTENRRHTFDELYDLFNVEPHVKGPLLHRYSRTFYEDVWKQVVPDGFELATGAEFSEAKMLIVTRVVNEKCGLSTFSFLSHYKNRLFVKVRADVGDLVAEAERSEFLMPLSPLVDRACGVAAHAPFRQEKDLLWLWEKHKHEDGKPTLFKPIDRVKLINNTIERFINHEVLVHLGIAEAYYPMHHPEILEDLRASWLPFSCCKCFELPLDKIRTYFGEEIAMYHAFLGHQTAMLIPVALIGLIAMSEIIAQSIDEKWEKTGLVWMPGFCNFIFAVIMAMWSAFFMEMWNRKEMAIALQWGTAELGKHGKERPAFYGMPSEQNPEGREPSELVGTINVYTAADGKKKTIWQGRKEIHYPTEQRMTKVMWSTIFLVTTLLILLGVIVSIIIFRNIMVASDTPWVRENAVYIAAFVNVIQINIFNIIYSMAAEGLTEWENWRTHNEHKQTLVRKLFIFQFINNFNTFFYMAFYKAFDIGCLGGCKQAMYKMPFDPTECTANLTDYVTSLGGTPEAPVWNLTQYPAADYDDEKWGAYTGDCMQELRVQLLMIFGLSLMTQNFIEIVVPAIMEKIKDRMEDKKYMKVVGGTEGQQLLDEEKDDSKSQPLLMKDVRSEAEKQINFDEYDTFDDYLEMMIQYGFIVLFVIAFPVIPMLALLNCVIELRIDSFKVCYYMKRPIPVTVGSIGGWKDSVNFISSVAVITNGWLFAFHSEMMEEWGKDRPDIRLAAFIAFVSVIWVLQFIVKVMIPDVPLHLQNIKSRHTSLVNSLVDGMSVIHDEAEQPVGESFTHDLHEDDTTSDWQTDK